MKTKINNYQSLLLEKQRLRLVCASQEKEMLENFDALKDKLNPTYMLKEAILEIVPREIRENQLVSFLSSFLTGSKKEDKGIGSDFFTLLKTSLLTAALNFLNKFLEKE